MDSKKYLDKVIYHLVRSTKIDYDKEEITFSFSLSSFSFTYKSTLPTIFSFLSYSFEIYCKNTYGLTEEEIKYIYKQYRDIIKDKIKNGQ